MKSLLACALLLACSGCATSQQPAARIEVTTPIGRKELATERYTLAEIEKESAAAQKDVTDSFDIQHPVYPSEEQLAALKKHLTADAEIWYFRGLDSGWAVVKGGQVAWVLVTSHEY